MYNIYQKFQNLLKRLLPSEIYKLIFCILPTTKGEINFIFYFFLPCWFIWSSFAYDAFVIPSESMYPNLKVGDYLFASKDDFGVNKYSFPLSLGLTSSDIFSSKILQYRKPKRGEIIVFRPPHDIGKHFVKRIIGMPGDTIHLVSGKIYINGEPVKHKQIEDCQIEYSTGEVCSREQYLETLPNGKTYKIAKKLDWGKATFDDLPVRGYPDMDEIKVSEGEYFVMGDNRDDSGDSREWGPLPENLILGRPRFVILSLAPARHFFLEQFLLFPFFLRYDRFFTLLADL